MMGIKISVEAGGAGDEADYGNRKVLEFRVSWAAERLKESYLKQIKCVCRFVSGN